MVMSQESPLGSQSGMYFKPCLQLILELKIELLLRCNLGTSLESDIE